MARKTLQDFQDAVDQASAALTSAQDRLGRARERARAAIISLARIERDSVDRRGVDPAAIAAAKADHDQALAQLAVVAADLLPDDLPPAPGS